MESCVLGYVFVLVDPAPGPGRWAQKLARVPGLGPVPEQILGPKARAQALDSPNPKKKTLLHLVLSQLIYL